MEIPEKRLDLLLLSMPFGPLRQPSLGLSLFKASVPRRRVEVLYLNLVYARRIGCRLYQEISGLRFPNEAMVGEWLFSAALAAGPTGNDAPGDDGFLDAILAPSMGGGLHEDDRARLLALRRDASAFLAACGEEVLRRRPRAVGFTSVFQQHLASLALARWLRQARPELPILFGGANCEGVMGLETVRSFGAVDAVVSGEADALFSTVLDRVLVGEPIEDLVGVYTRGNLAAQDRVRPASAPRVPHLDDLPRPAYDDFFAQWRAQIEAGGATEPAAGQPGDPLSALGPVPRVLFETSRGCWWGEKVHCTFCGLNGTSMAFRSKSAERALAELGELSARHPGVPVLVVDNILDMRYFRDFVPALAQAQLGVELFYEVKANLKKEQVRQLSAAGIREIQPGIESLSDQVLALMGKGVTALQNIQLLKWCRELEVWPSWNLIWGFPGESPDEYRRMAELLPLLHHLPPPGVSCPIQIHRFSPNFERAEEMGFAAVRPAAPYRYLYRLPPEAVHNLAYYFDYSYADHREVGSYTAGLAAGVEQWQRGFASSQLVSVEQGEALVVWDLRPVAARPLTRLTGRAREIYQACDGIRTCGWLRDQDPSRGAGAAAHGPLSEGELEELVGPLVEDGLMVRDGERLLSLAVPK